MENRIANVKQRLLQELQHLPEWSIDGVELVGNGVECVVFRAVHREYGPLAVRVPWEKSLVNLNDPVLDGWYVLQKEAFLARYMYEQGLPTPNVYVLHPGKATDFLASDLVVHDRSLPSFRQMGELARQLHELPVPEHEIWKRTDSGNDKLAERLVRRTQIVMRETGERFDHMPSVQEVKQLLDLAPAEERSVLHMDFRPANLLTYHGEIRAIIDWSNAIIGHPGLELARISESGFCEGYDNGFTTPDFVSGYGAADLDDLFEGLPKVVELLYRLDTATMLTNVFLCSAPDPVLVRVQVERLRHLHDLLRKELQ